MQMEGQNFASSNFLFWGDSVVCLLCSEKGVNARRNFSKRVTDTGFLKRKEAYFAQTQLLKSLFAIL